MSDDLATSAESETRRGATAGVTPANPPGYQLIDEVGRGGMGVVYRGRDVALNRDVAVKLLAERYPVDSLPAQRFLSEARITGQLQHPGIPAVHQVGTLADGRPFLAMKLIKGRTLETILKHRPDPAAERGRLLAIFEAVCQAVGYAHAHRVIHRDLKPANVMVGAFAEVQVMDWGLAKVLGEETPAAAEALEAEQTRAWTEIQSTPESGSHTQAGSLVGTPAFIPPEQALGEIDKVDARSDVFGLGALLAVILTGKPPYVGETAESVRVQAVRGKLDDCFARLDASVAEPELVALCKRCLAFEPADRPAEAGAVAAAVAGLRAAADERARVAELERVRALGERATAEAQAAERRKRRRLWLGAAASLAVAVVGGLVAVVVVQRRANAELASEQEKVQARFEMAVKAIETFHTGVSEEALLKNAEFKELRTKLLEQAKGFYEGLEQLLAGQTDARSRRTLAEGYYQLADLTNKIGDHKEALAVHRKALAIRRELAAADGANVEARLDVARSLHATGLLLRSTGDRAGALAAFQEQRDLAAVLEAESPTDAVRLQLAFGHNGIGFVQHDADKSAEALDSYRKALAVYQQLPESVQYPQPGVGPTFGLQLQAGTNMSISAVLAESGKPAEESESFRKASDIMRKLADAHPANTSVQSYLAITYNNLGALFLSTGKPEEALEPLRKALAIQQKLVDVSPAVTEFRQGVGWSHFVLGAALLNSGKPAEAHVACRKALTIYLKLVDDQPAVPALQHDLSRVHNHIGLVLVSTGKPAEALEAYRKALPIVQNLVDADPGNSYWQSSRAKYHINIGRALDRQKRLAEALTAIDVGLKALQKLVESEPNAIYSWLLVWSHGSRGGARVRAGQPAEAAADLRKVLELWAMNTQPDIETQLERARAQANLAGLGAEANSGVTKDEAKAFADQSVAALAAVVKTGWALPSELKEPDFDALRGRDDFKKLIAEVEAKVEAATKEAEPK